MLKILRNVGFWGYVAGVVLRSRPVKWAAAAAVVVAAVTLFVMFISTGDAMRPQHAGQAFEHQHPAQPTVLPDAPAVATITATHNATWAHSAEGASAPGSGSKLKPGQQLTLTAGFAEITTARGAIAILEAPVSIELLDNDNAIHLHAGKLLGICETESAKGFLVRTPHMDVIDLGTRFGVSAHAQRTEVHVDQGQVRVSRLNAEHPSDSLLLNANQSARFSQNNDALVRIEPDTESFAAMLPRTLALPGTGLGLQAGQPDPNWHLIANDGQALAKPQPLQVSDDWRYLTRHPNDPASSQWLVWTPSEQRGDEHGYLIRTAVDLPESAKANSSKIVLRYMADNELRSVRVNGQQVELPKVDVTDQFTRFHEAAITDHLTAGPNTFEFELINLKIADSAGPAGLRLHWWLESPAALGATQP